MAIAAKEDEEDEATDRRGMKNNQSFNSIRFTSICR